MTSILDPTTIGRPKRPRKHVRSLTSTFKDFIISEHIGLGYLSGYIPEEDAFGKEKWPRGEEEVWKDGYRELDTSE